MRHLRPCPLRREIKRLEIKVCEQTVHTKSHYMSFAALSKSPIMSIDAVDLLFLIVCAGLSPSKTHQRHKCFLQATAWMLGHTTWQRELSADECSAPSLLSSLPATTGLPASGPLNWDVFSGCTSLISAPAPLYACSSSRMPFASFSTTSTCSHTSRSASVGWASAGKVQKRQQKGGQDWSIVQNLPYKS